MGLSKRLYEEISEFERLALEGETNELEAYIHLKELGEFVETTKKNLTDSALRKVALEGGKTEQFGYLCNSSQKVTWKFDHITAWKDKKKELESIEEKAKLSAQLSDKMQGEHPIENFENNIADTSTGEVMDVAIKTFSAPFLTIKKIGK